MFKSLSMLSEWYKINNIYERVILNEQVLLFYVVIASAKEIIVKFRGEFRKATTMKVRSKIICSLCTLYLRAKIRFKISILR